MREERSESRARSDLTGVETCDFVGRIQIRDYLRQRDSIYALL